MTSRNKIQLTDSPWVYSLNTLQYEQLFDVSPQMEEVIGEELNITFLRDS